MHAPGGRRAELRPDERACSCIRCRGVSVCIALAWHAGSIAGFLWDSVPRCKRPVPLPQGAHWHATLLDLTVPHHGPQHVCDCRNPSTPAGPGWAGLSCSPGGHGLLVDASAPLPVCRPNPYARTDGPRSSKPPAHST